jgi:hypothetical protein
VSIKGPKTYYNYEEVVPGIRYYILEYIRNLDTTLEWIERARATIRPKSQFYIPGLKLVSYVTNTDKRYLLIARVIKILE